ncbi:MAG: hypothetical protein HY275_19500 [Gemmatimonadetes bacterium]|nr:hypothetical protein [Gemmatimonadota bacterium]
MLPTDPNSAAALSSGRGAGASGTTSGGACLSVNALYQLAQEVFTTGGPNYKSVTAKIDQVARALARRDSAAAKTAAMDAVQFILLKLGQRRTAGLTFDAQQLINGILCMAGLVPGSGGTTVLILPSDQAQVIVNTTGDAGVAFPANPVSEPTLLTISAIPNTFPLGGGPLNTKLDQYPGYFEFTKLSATNAPLTAPVIVGVCPAITVPDSIRNRLRLGHQASFGFEVTPPAPANFLTCPPSIASGATSTGSAWLATIANLVLPTVAHAASRLGTGGVGGSANEFSPFAPVDPVLSFGGGVGGSANEFLRTPALPTVSDGPGVTAVPGAPARALQATPGRTKGAFALDCSVAPFERMPLAPECRPLVTLTTLLGTPFTNVPITWQVTAGGGSIAPEDPSTLACGTFASVAQTLTGPFGKSGICWTTGHLPGLNTVVATPNLGGDAIPGVSFFPPSLTFNVMRQ